MGVLLDSITATVTLECSHELPRSHAPQAHDLDFNSFAFTPGIIRLPSFPLYPQRAEHSPRIYRLRCAGLRLSPTTFFCPAHPHDSLKMARNKEKAQSMLHRFREAQAIELGLGSGATGRGPGAGDRRPRLASSVKTLKECEKWRSEVLREISRKVSKIQDCK